MDFRQFATDNARAEFGARYDHPREERHYKPLSDVSGILWRVYAPDVSAEDIALDFDLEGHRISSAYDCTGLAFSFSARIRWRGDVATVCARLNRRRVSMGTV